VRAISGRLLASHPNNRSRAAKYSIGIHVAPAAL
jgi:hypothetical protein